MTETDFTSNWASSRDYWQDMFDELGWTGEPHLHFLEVGCFEGQASLWLMENVLTDPSSWLTVIDPFDITRGELNNGERFRQNLAPYLGRIIMRVGRSADRLRDVYIERSKYVTPQHYDFVYVDGSHRSADVLSDAVLAWPLLRPGGVMCFDDYQWDDVVLEYEKPQIAVDAFVRCYQDEIADARRRGMDQYVVRRKDA